jgi:thiopurine S-methyltransferase
MPSSERIRSVERSDWASRWKEGRIAFHQSRVTNFLDKYAEPVWGTDALGRICVPLCGKSLDMVFLAGRAAEVVGVEYVEQAVSEFFVERGLTPEIETDPAIRYSAGNYVLFAADFFSLTQEHLGPIDAVFDRASLVALDRAARIRYANHLRSLLRERAKTLLVTFDYDQAEMNGPPFAVSPDEVHRLFDDGFEVEHLETRDALDDRFRTQGLTAMRESAFRLTCT